MLAPNAALAQAQGVRGEASVTTTGGYGRIVIRTAADVESQVRMTSGILVIQFRQPVNDRGRPARHRGQRIYRRGAARSRRPRVAVCADAKGQGQLDGRGRPAVRRSAARELDRRAARVCRVRWSRNWPSAPTRPTALARQKLAAESSRRKFPPVRVRVAAQPTFTRYIFELPELTGVTAERGKDKLTLTFAKPLRFDLSDAKLAAAKAVAAVDAAGSGDNPEVQFKFSQQADIRTFREDSNYVVDVSPIDAKAQPPLSQPVRSRRHCAGNDPGQRAQAVESKPSEPSRRQAVSQCRARRSQCQSKAAEARRADRCADHRAARCRHAQGRRRRGRAAGACGESSRDAPARPAKLDPEPPGRSPSCGGRATTCGCSFRSRRRRLPRCSSAPTRCGWCSTPRPCSTSACSATTRARPSTVPP